jgi:peptidoglycan hydrolase-like protein with peptidoglycan-binding domain
MSAQSLVTLLLSLVAVVGVAPSAGAATSSCTGAHEWVRPSSTAEAVARFPEAGGSRTCLMGTWLVGQDNAGVLALQYSLWRCGGYLPLSGVDGRFGDQTKKALIQAQREVGAAADGIYGPESASKLLFAGREVSEWGDGYRCLPGSRYTVRR